MMAKPRVFISSTYYDLKHLRSSLEKFIVSLGFEPVLSEKGSVAYSPEVPLDISCYREVNNCDIFVLIIGGRYGSETSKSSPEEVKDFYSKYDSITKMEYKTATLSNVPIYILINSSVYSEYQTFKINPKNESIRYAHVDSINIFYLIEDILLKNKNNPLHEFDKYSDIESWLISQWAGLFKQLINSLMNENQLQPINAKISEIKEINETLKNYIESVIKTINPKHSNELISVEEKRLNDARVLSALEELEFIKYIKKVLKISLGNIQESLFSSNTINEFIIELSNFSENNELLEDIKELYIQSVKMRSDMTEARELFGLQAY